MLVLIILSSIAALFIIDLIVNRQAKDVRLQMATSAKRLIDSDELSDNQKSLILNMLDDAFSWKFLVYFAIRLPFLAFGRAKRKRSTAKIPEEYMALMQNEEFNKFSDLHMQSVMASNFPVALVLLLELVILIFIAMMFGFMRSFREVLLATVFLTTPKVRPKSGKADFA